MARDRANIRTDIWNDDDFRLLSPEAQLLYLQLLTSATLTYAGVADWRPKRIAHLAAGRSADDVDRAADELVRGLYIVVDEGTEEVLIRSFLKHDGLLQKPNVAKAMVTAYGQVYSMDLKGVIVHELKRLHERFPDWKGFGVREVQDLTLNRSVNPSDLIPEPLSNPSPNPSEKKGSLLTTNYLLPTTNSLLPAISNRELEDLFAQAYSRWPKKTERKKSWEKFKLLAGKREAAVLADDITRFGDAYSATTETQFVPALNVWLNGERWTDELPSSPQQQQQPKLSKAAQNAEEYRRLFGGDERNIQALDPGISEGWEDS